MSNPFNAPPPYVPLNQNQQMQYAPPPGPPPGHPSAQYPYQSPAGGAYGAPQGPYPPQQQPQQYPGQSPAPPLATGPQSSVNPGWNAGPAPPGSFVDSPHQASFPAVSGPGGIQPPQRTGTLQGHVQRMSSMNAGGPGARGREDPLAFLSTFDTVFIIDDSSSMEVNERRDGSMGKSRWEEARDALAGMVELAAKYDDDGIDVHFFNSFEYLEGCRDPNLVRQLFERVTPNGVTPLGEKLEMLLLGYLDAIEDWKAGKRAPGQKEPKKRNYIIITDGAATDDPESVIVAIARRLDNGNFPLSQIGVQLLQVGDDAEATEALVELDDALSKEHHIRDMVDTVTYSGMELSADTIVKALLGAVNRRYDRKKQ